MTQPDWIALDWGTSRMRAWAMSASGAVLASVECERGMRYLEASDYESVLVEQISSWLLPGRPILVIACGMLGSKQGWFEAPYLSAPCRPLGELVTAPVRGRGLDLRICPGIKQELPADVMRGEEVQVAGLLASDAEFDGVACLPGTHSKWVRICGGRVRSFQTFLTGELFALLAEQSVLRHSVVADGWDEEIFLHSVEEMIAAPELLSSRLFSIRAESLLGGRSGVAARSRLSGYLIGAELAATKTYWQDRSELALIGSGRLTELYAGALAALGKIPRIYPGDKMTQTGLYSAYLSVRHA